MKAKIAKKKYLETSVAFTFDNGQSIEVSLGQFSPEIGLQLSLYGIAQKIGDAYAGSKSPGEAYDEAATMVAQLMAGDWKAGRETTGPKSGKTVRALERLIVAGGKTAKVIRAVLGLIDDVSLEAIRAAFAGQSDERRKAIMQSKDVRTELAVMAAEESSGSLADLA